jgi:hypothetical protein
MHRFVAFLDILGFEKLVYNNEFNTMVSVIKSLKASLDYANQIPIPKGVNLRIDEKLIGSTMFSDSILLYTDNDDPYNFCRLTHVTKFLIYSAFSSGIALRGAITNGEMLSVDGMYMGKPLIEAYKAEEEQEWCGVYIIDDTIDYVRSKNPDCIDFLVKIATLVEYCVPFKKNKDGSDKMASKYNFCINWANLDFDSIFESRVRSAFPFLWTEIGSFIDKGQKLSKEEQDNLYFPVDFSHLNADVQRKNKNTQEFYYFARNKGTVPFSYGE